MKNKAAIATIIIVALIFAFEASPSLAQVQPIYVALGGGAHGTLNKPTSGTYHPIGIIAAHRTANMLGSCTGWASRGFLAFCLNFPWVNNEAAVMWEDTARHVGSAVTFLRNQPGITKVVLVGASGGGPTMSYFQAVAENGPSYCQGLNKLIPCTSSNFPAALIPADGIIFNDAHPGNTINSLRSINGAVLNEKRPENLNPRLNPFDPKNGYNPNGPSHYPEAFQKRYFGAQSDRMNILIHEALQILRQIENSDNPTDDAPFPVARGDNARLLELDPSIHHSTVKPRQLLKNDGTVDSCCIVESVRISQPGDAEDNASFNDGTPYLTVRSFLSANAIRSTDSMDGLEYCSSNNSTVCALQQISVPVLIVASGGHYFIRDNEVHYEVAKSSDKEFIVTEGAAHTGGRCVPCESFPGQYANSAVNQMNYMVNWLLKPGRFIP